MRWSRNWAATQHPASAPSLRSPNTCARAAASASGPRCLLLAAHQLGFSGQGAIRLGAVVEMVHTATLVHDDIIDGADTRRGTPSANTTWGNEKCVLAGDWLYMQAFKVALEEQNLRVLDLLIGLTQQMVEGELLQIQKLGKSSPRPSTTT